MESVLYKNGREHQNKHYFYYLFFTITN